MESAHNHTAQRKTSGWLKQAVMVLLAIALILGIVAVIGKVYLVHPSGRDINSKEYQALFLTNGQVYFGKLSRPDATYVKLTDIYYLQTQPAQPSSGSNTSTQQSLSLAKLGNELHGPEDAMFVAKSQVLFWENLKDSGKVVQAIKAYQAGQK